MEYTDDQINASPEILKEFLEGMPEIIINPEDNYVKDIVDNCYNGDPHKYILESFIQFLEQVHC